MTENRLPPIAPEDYTEEQKAAAATFFASRNMEVFGPFSILLRSPDVLVHASALGQYLRYRTQLGARLSEFAILVVARHWTQDYEWHVHYPFALEAGVKAATAEAIADGRRPENMEADEAAVYDFNMELFRNKRVSDATYARALKIFGEQGVIDLTAINGYYSLLAMTMNVARMPISAAGKKLPRLPE